MKYYNSLIILLTILGCGESNYVQNCDTPLNLNGFAGFRWTTPMSLIEEQLSKKSYVKPIPELNTFESTHFSNVEFMEYEGFDCAYYFSKRGLIKTSLSFQSTPENAEIVFNEILVHLVNIYGEPRKTISQRTRKSYPNFLVGFSWFECELEIFLNMKSIIIINAYESHTCGEGVYTR